MFRRRVVSSAGLCRASLKFVVQLTGDKLMTPLLDFRCSSQGYLACHHRLRRHLMRSRSWKSQVIFDALCFGDIIVWPVPCEIYCVLSSASYFYWQSRHSLPLNKCKSCISHMELKYCVYSLKNCPHHFHVSILWTIVHINYVIWLFSNMPLCKC